MYIITTVAVAGSLLYFLFNPAISAWFPRCFFFALTGLYCPGCGSQRAFHALLHGDVLSAAGYNMLLVASLPLVAFSAIVNTNNILRKKKMKQDVFNSPQVAIILLIAVIFFAVLRNIPFWPFDLMAP